MKSFGSAQEMLQLVMTVRTATPSPLETLQGYRSRYFESKISNAIETQLSLMT